MQTREEEVTNLARQLSRRSSVAPQQNNGLVRQLTGRSSVAPPPEKLFNYEEDSDLDPFSNNFNAKKYVKGMAGLSEEAGVQRLAGVSYKNMAVHGFGSDAGESLDLRLNVSADLQITKRLYPICPLPWPIKPEISSATASERYRS